MLQIERNSRTRVDMLKEHKKQRMDELKGLIAKDRELCDIMCSSPFSIDKDTVPSLKQLESYRAYLDNLAKEKVLLMVISFSYPFAIFPKDFSCDTPYLEMSFQEQRHHEFVSLKKLITECMEELEKSPETSFEMDVVCEDEDAFCLSDENIDSLKLLLTQVLAIFLYK